MRGEGDESVVAVDHTYLPGVYINYGRSTVYSPNCTMQSHTHKFWNSGVLHAVRHHTYVVHKKPAIEIVYFCVCTVESDGKNQVRSSTRNKLSAIRI